MSADDPASRQVSRVELDQRSRAARLRIENLERALAVDGAPPPAAPDRSPTHPVAANILPLPLRRLRRS